MLFNSSGIILPISNQVSPLNSLSTNPYPQDKILLTESKKNFEITLKEFAKRDRPKSVKVEDLNYNLTDGDVVIAAITSCTNTSNPNVLIAAGLLAKKAVEKGLIAKPWVKTSLAPGSQVVTDYLNKAGLSEYLDKLGFNLVGYGCTTCIGNSGPLPEKIVNAVKDNDLYVSAVLSGNRNFEGRINPSVKANYLASPPLVVAYAIAGTANFDLYKDPLGKDKNGKEIKLGIKAKSNLTGFTGVLTGHSNYIHGCDHWHIQPVVTKDGSHLCHFHLLVLSLSIIC